MRRSSGIPHIQGLMHSITNQAAKKPKRQNRVNFYIHHHWGEEETIHYEEDWKARKAALEEESLGLSGTPLGKKALEGHALQQKRTTAQRLLNLKPLEFQVQLSREIDEEYEQQMAEYQALVSSPSTAEEYNEYVRISAAGQLLTLA